MAGSNNRPRIGRHKRRTKDPTALNCNAEAQEDDGSCFYEDDVLGCTEESALNYNPAATYDDGSCTYAPLSLTDVAPEQCMGDMLEITWTGGNPNGSVNMSLINVTDNYVYASLGVMDNTGVFLWMVEGIDPYNTYRLYLEEHPYPPSDWTYGNNFTFLEDCTFACPAHVDDDGSIATGDVLIMLSEFGCTSNCAADITGDRAVTVDDFPGPPRRLRQRLQLTVFKQVEHRQFTAIAKRSPIP